MNTKHHFEQQAEFMDVCGLPRRVLKQLIDEELTHPTFIQQVSLWDRLINEEVNHELRIAVNRLMHPMQTLYNSRGARVDLVTEIADGIVDAVYVIDGLCNLLGLPREALFNEVHRSNMAKATRNEDGTYSVKRRPDGKILKPEGWTAPNLRAIILEHCKDDESR